MSLNFDITANTSDFTAKMSAVITQVEKTADVMKQVGKEFDISNAENQVAALQKVIADNEAAMAASATTIKRWQADAQAAFNNGDFGLFKTINLDIKDQIANMEGLIQETNTYRTALSQVEAISGMQQSQGDGGGAKFFKTQADFDAAENLKQKIAEVRAQIATFDGSEADLQGLKNQLSTMQSDLAVMNTAASTAASALGENLGNKAAETSTKLYALNNAIKQQETTVAGLKQKLDEATTAFNNMSASEEPQVVEEARQKVDSLTSTYNNAVQSLNTLKAAQQDTSTSMQGISTQIAQHDSVLVKMLGGYENYQAILGKMPAGLQGVVSGMTAMTGAAKAFIATPLGAIIGAIALALMALKKWFNETAEGQKAFAVISGYVGGVLRVLQNIVLAVGKALYTAFTDPKKAISELWTFLKAQLINRIKAVGGIFTGFGKIITAAFSFDLGKIKAALKDYANAWLQLGTGVENSIDKVSGAMKKLGAAAKEGASIASAKKALAAQKSQWKVTAAQYDKQLAEYQSKAFNAKLSSSERQKYIDLYKSTVDKKQAGEKNLKQSEYSIYQREMSMKNGNLSVEDKAKGNQLKKELIDIDTQTEQMKRRMIRRENSLFTQSQSAARKEESAHEKHQKEMLALQEKYDKDMESLAVREEQARAALLDNSRESQEAKLKAELNKKLADEMKRAADYSKSNKKSGKGESYSFDLGNGEKSENYQLTKEQYQKQQSIVNSYLEWYKRQRIEIVKSEYADMRNYLIEYGNYQQKKKAIEEEYAQKINDATTEGQRLSLEKERDSKISDAKATDLRDNIDWTTVFGSLGGMFKDVIEPVLNDAKEYIKTDQFKNSDESSKQALIEAIRQMEKSVGGADKVSFAKLGKEIEKYRTTQNKLTKAQEKQKDLQSELSEAQKNYVETLKDGTEEEQEAAKDRVKNAKSQLKAADKEVEAMQMLASESQQSVSNTASSLKTSMDGVTDGLQKLTSGGLKNAYDGFIEFSKNASQVFGGAIGDKLGEVADSLESVPIVGWILSIIDIFKDGLSDLVGSLLDGIFNAIGGILDDILSGDLFATIGESIFNGLGSIFNAITFGGWNSWFGGADYSEYNRLKEKYEDLIDVWDTIISKKEEYIDISYGDEARKVGKEVEELYKSQAEATRTLAKKYLNSGASAGSSSIGQRQWKNMTKEAKNELKAIFGDDYKNDLGSTRMTKLFDMSAEQLENLRDKAPTFWAGLSSQVREYLEKIIECGEAIDENKEKMDEATTGVSFDSFYDDWVSLLEDMDKSAADFSDSFGEYLRNSIIENLLANKYKQKIQDLYDNWVKLSDKNGDGTFDLTSADANTLKEQQEKLAQELLNERDLLIETFGSSVSSQQSASEGSFSSMSEDTANELNGRFTALQIAGESINTQMVTAVERLSNMSGMITISNSYLSDILSQHAISNSYLDDISRYAKKTYLEIEGRMEKLVNNTQNL